MSAHFPDRYGPTTPEDFSQGPPHGRPYIVLGAEQPYSSQIISVSGAEMHHYQHLQLSSPSAVYCSNFGQRNATVPYVAHQICVSTR